MAHTILIVDDNELIRVLASRTLAEAGFVPFTAASGSEALQLLDVREFDLVVVDFFMPEMLGDELTRRVRSDPRAAVRRIPVLGLSGSHKDAERRFARAGATAYVRKPLHEGPLLAAVNRLL